MNLKRACRITVGPALVLAILFGGSAAVGEGHWRFEAKGGTTVLDSGPFGLDGTLNPRPFRVAEVPVDPVPQDDAVNGRSLDLGWLDGSSGGFFTVEDPTGQLTFGHRSFTIEAWVRLDHVSDAGSSNQRQWLCMKKPLPSADVELDYGFLVQAGTAGASGRELAFLYGDGEVSTTIVSSLEIADFDWHFVSIAYSLEDNALRFGVDGAFETVSLDKPGFALWLPVLNSGPLRVGGHQNAGGTNNQFLRGSIDELRISRGFLPVERLLDAAWPDCNGTGTPDASDVLDGTSEDCNGNFVPDECDLASGASLDCQGDGIPDECQLAVSPSYRWDDDRWEGWPGYSTTFSDGAYTGWLQNFTVTDGAGLITHVDMQVSELAVGGSMTLHIWSDPDGDGDPTDAQVLSSLPVQIDESMGYEFVRFDVPDVDVGPDGVSFFVGGVMHQPVSSALMIDFAPPHYFGVSWIVGRSTPIDPNDLSAEAVEFALIEASFPGNYVVRAVSDPGLGYADCNGNGVPDWCDIESGGSGDLDGNGVPDECECIGDIDGDGLVDAGDLAAVLGAWGACDGCAEDLDGSGVVNSSDLALILVAWGDC